MTRTAASASGASGENGIHPSSIEVRSARRRVEAAQKAELEAALEVVRQEIVLVQLRGKRAARKDDRLDAAVSWRALDRERRGNLARRARDAREARAREREQRQAARKLEQARRAAAKIKAKNGRRTKGRRRA